jgi:hypothetical protein
MKLKDFQLCEPMKKKLLVGFFIQTYDELEPRLWNQLCSSLVTAHASKHLEDSLRS